MKKNKYLFLIVILTVFFIFHNILLVISSGPTNPISAKYAKIADSYTSNIFSQNWHLFAPDPISTNTYIYIQISDNKNSNSTSWLDISTPLNESGKKILTPLNRTSRLTTGIFMDITGQNFTDDLLIKYVDKNDEANTKDPITIALKERNDKLQEIGEESLYRFVSYYIRNFTNELYNNLNYFRIKITVYDTVPFSFLY